MTALNRRVRILGFRIVGRFSQIGIGGKLINERIGRVALDGLDVVQLRAGVEACPRQ